MVKMNSKIHLIIGNGQSAFHLAEYFKLLSVNYRQWSRKTKSESELLELIETADVVFILIKDDAIIDFYSKHKVLKEKHCFHFSGALSSFGSCISIHPLMSFASRKPFDLDFYKSINFVTDHSLGSVPFPLPNVVQKISPEDKKRYHALCVMSGNFTVLLWMLAKKHFSEIGLAPQILDPYLKQIASQIIHDSEQALSGPLLRKDFRTISSHLSDIQGTELEPIYRGFLQSYFSEKDLMQIQPFDQSAKNEDLC